MVQSPDLKLNQPTYSAVKINIKNPVINSQQGENTKTDDNGIYNAVDITIDKPEVNTKQVYSYPEADSIVTYDMANINQIPVTFPISYQTTNVIIPKTDINNEFEFEMDAAPEEVEESDVIAEAEELAGEEIEEDDEIESPSVPEANYTTVEAEKAEVEDAEEQDNIVQDVEIMDAEVKAANIQKPEIIPGEEIKPDVDLTLVVDNLNSTDFDIQAQQMEEIARISLDNPENAVPYIIREVFSSLIEITQKDSTELAAPTEEQLDVRKKLITNYMVEEAAKAKDPQAQVRLPYQLSEQEIAIANEISPMEQAERNKEYALYTIAILTKIYTDEVEKQTGNIVPMTDLPGTSAIVDALRYNPNSGVKVAAIDALRHIQRPEYKEELSTLFTLAQADRNPEVADAASRALNRINN